MFFLILFLPISAFFAVFAVCMFADQRMGASGRGCIGGAIVSAGVWCCVGVFMVNALNAAVNGAEWHDMMPLYVAVMVVALGATIAKYALRVKQQFTNRLPNPVAAMPVYLARFECLSTAL